ncbi:MAG: hypothetical protein JXR65_08310 [Bacteroidales bacterium]|nr:hypothetical protein [Bacteroidales bacterium]
MKAFKSIIYLLFFVILLAWSNLQAQTERRVARDFVKSLDQNKKVVLITVPDYIYKYNLKKEILSQFPNATKKEQDSLLWVHSDFIKQINDSTFLSCFLKGYKSELKVFNLIPYVQSIPLGIAPPSYKINLAQIELEEQFYPFVDSAYYNNNALVFNKKLNAVDFSMWFKIHSLPSVQKDTTVLFSEYLLSDMVNNGDFFLQNNGKVIYYYKLDHLTLKKIYQYVENLGKIYAGYTFDYILNQQIKKVIPAFNSNKEYWHYDPYNKKLYTDNENRFINLQDQ